nr:hypothetical protein [Ktedonobacterales bacterium]
TQHQPGHLDVILALAPGVDAATCMAAVIVSLNATLARYGCQPFVGSVAPGEITRMPGMKRRRVRRVD